MADGLARSSAVVIRSTLATWYRHVGDGDWTPDAVRAWVASGNARPNTRKSRLTKLRPYCAWLVREGLLGTDPTEGVPLERPAMGAPRDLSDGEMARLVQACPDDRATLIVILMAQMGLRCGSVAAIRIEDINTRTRELGVRGKGTRGEIGTWVPIPTEAWGLVVGQVHRLGRSSGPLIESHVVPDKGISPQAVSKLVGRWIRDAGLKDYAHDGRSAHSLRHTAAQTIMDTAGDVRVVQYALGHKRLETTEIYLRRAPADLAAKLEGRHFLAVS